jgi:RND family efflux transporter MFP subunit
MRGITWAVLAIAVAAAAGCSRQQVNAEGKKESAPEALAINVATAELRRFDRTLGVTGSLDADERVNLTFEVPGRISSIKVDFGQPVKKGQVIAELDRREYEIQVERTRAALNQSLARLGLSPGQENVVPESTPSVRQAQAQLEDARFKYESAAKLVKTGDISQERFTEVEKAYRARQAAFEAARDDLRTLWASMEGLRADLKLVEKRLSDTVIRAPFDGAITDKPAAVGQFVKDNNVIVTIVKAYPLRLRLEVPETASVAVRPGSTLTFTTDGIPREEFKATVRELNPSLDQKSRTLVAEARLLSNDSRLRPGNFVRVNLVIERNAQQVMVPKQAVYTVAGLTKVFVVKDGKAIEKRVNPTPDQGGWVEVPPDMVNAGDRVAVSKLGALYNGAPVSAGGKS